MKTGTKIGIIIGSFAVIGAAVGAIVYFKNKKEEANADKDVVVDSGSGGGSDSGYSTSTMTQAEADKIAKQIKQLESKVAIIASGGATKIQATTLKKKLIKNGYSYSNGIATKL